MTNDEVYAAGLLIRALDPATQPPEIRAFLSAELELLSEIVGPGTRMIDIGCGTGRHLAFLGERLRLGVGVDYEFIYILEAQRRVTSANLRSEHFSEARLRTIIGDCDIRPLGDVAYAVHF